MPRKIVLKISKGEAQENAVWFMRQAGRYLKEYQDIKSGKTFNDILADPDSIYRLSILPTKYIKTDAIVIFTDILIPLGLMGYKVSYENGINVTYGDTDYKELPKGLSQAIKMVSSDYGDLTIIGVVGGPFTTLSYIYEKGKAGYHLTKKEVLERGEVLMSQVIENTLNFAKLQADSGVDVIQIFESWLGSLSETFYEMHVKRWEEYFVEKVRQFGKPVIFFSEGSSHLSRALSRLEADVFSVDWRQSLTRYTELYADRVIQGNLDPDLLDSPDFYLKKEVRRIMREGKSFKGHIFNLGHGVPKWADWNKLSLVADEVHNFDQ
ncbi:MAG: uroporphyrinogen decarboxylase family protein [Thermoplasmatales archaeon]